MLTEVAHFFCATL